MHFCAMVEVSAKMEQPDYTIRLEFVFTHNLKNTDVHKPCLSNKAIQVLLYYGIYGKLATNIII